MAAFGGEYRAPEAKRLLGEVAARLVAATERPDERYEITILDSPSRISSISGAMMVIAGPRHSSTMPRARTRRPRRWAAVTPRSRMVCQVRFGIVMVRSVFQSAPKLR